MRIVKQSATRLIIKTREKRLLLMFGLAILLGGLLTTLFVRIPPLKQRDLRLSSIFYQQQEGSASFEPETPRSSVADTGLRLAYYVGRLSFTGERPVVALALISIVAGFIILVGPYRGDTFTLDKSRQQVVYKQSGWFFQAKCETYPFRNIAAIRVERDRSNIRSKQYFGVSLVISQSEGRPLSRNYLYHKSIYPLSRSNAYDYERAREMVAQIQKFTAEP